MSGESEKYGRVRKRSRESCDDHNMAQVPRNLTPPPAHRTTLVAALAPTPKPEPAHTPAPANAVAAAAVASAAAEPPLPPSLPLPLPFLEELVTVAPRLMQAWDLGTLAGYFHATTSSFHETMRQSTRDEVVQQPNFDFKAETYGRVPKWSRESCNDHNMAEVPRNLTLQPAHRAAAAAALAPAPLRAPAPAVAAAAAVANVAAKPPLLPSRSLPLLPMPMLEEREAPRMMQARNFSTVAGYFHDATSSFYETLRQSPRGVVVQQPDFDFKVPRNLTPPPAHRTIPVAALARASKPKPAHAPAAAVASVAAKPPLPPSLPLPPLPRPMLEELVTDVPRLIMARNLAALAGCIHNATSSFHETLRLSTRGELVQVPAFNFEGEEGNEAANSTTDRLTDARCLLWNAASERFTFGIQQLIDFAKRLPGFSSLQRNDQIILIKQGFFEVYITRAHASVMPDYMLLDDGSIITQDHLGILYSPAFAASMLSYMWSLWQMQLNNDEVGALTGLLLVAPTRVGLIRTQEVARLQRAFGDALRIAVTQHADPLLAEERLHSLLVLVDEARLLGQQHAPAMLWCRHNRHRLTLPGLFAEVFDLPKSKTRPTKR